MAASSREELAMYGYVREYFRLQRQECPANDIIDFFVSWLTFSIMDFFDKTISHSSIAFDLENDRRIKGDGKKPEATAIGKLIVEKGCIQQWKFKFLEAATMIIGIVDIETPKKETTRLTPFQGYDGYVLELCNYDL
eukprot:118648_1